VMVAPTSDTVAECASYALFCQSNLLFCNLLQTWRLPLSSNPPISASRVSEGD
jgi:hypothetical protein